MSFDVFNHCDLWLRMSPIPNIRPKLISHKESDAQFLLAQNQGLRAGHPSRLENTRDTIRKEEPMSIEQEIIKRMSVVIDAIAAHTGSNISSSSVALDTNAGAVFVEEVKQHSGMHNAATAVMTPTYVDVSVIGLTAPEQVLLNEILAETDTRNRVHRIVRKLHASSTELLSWRKHLMQLLQNPMTTVDSPIGSLPNSVKVSDTSGKGYGSSLSVSADMRQ